METTINEITLILDTADLAGARSAHIKDAEIARLLEYQDSKDGRHHFRELIKEPGNWKILNDNHQVRVRSEWQKSPGQVAGRYIDVYELTEEGAYFIISQARTKKAKELTWTLIQTFGALKRRYEREVRFLASMTEGFNSVMDRGIERIEGILKFFVDQTANLVLEQMPTVLDQYFQTPRGSLSKAEVAALLQKIHEGARIEGKNLHSYHWELKRQFRYATVELVTQPQRKLLERHLDEVIERHVEPPPVVAQETPAPAPEPAQPERAPLGVANDLSKFHTIAEWYRHHGKWVRQFKAMTLGARASEMSRDLGFPILRKPHSKFETVGSYHENILREVCPL